MKELLFIPLFLILVNGVNNAQITIKGSILDSETRKGIEYASVYKEGTNIGCYSDSEGNFILDNLKSIPDTLTISCVGYESKKIYKSYLEVGDIIAMLDSKLNQLDEVTVKSEKLKRKTVTLGSNNRKLSNRSPLYYASQRMRFFKSNKTPSYIENFSFYVTDISGDNKARIRIYNVDSLRKTPDSDILNHNVIVKDIRKGWNSVDLSEYRLIIPKEGFFIGLESIVIDKDSFERVNGYVRATKYHDFVIGCVKEQTITARKNLRIGDYLINGEVKIPASANDWRLDPPNYGFDLLYRVKVAYYK